MFKPQVKQRAAGELFHNITYNITYNLYSGTIKFKAKSLWGRA